MRKINLFKKEILLSMAVILIISAFFTNAFSYPGGITGKTKKTTTTGCSCHTFGTQTTGTLTGPDTVMAGQTAAYTISITRTATGKLGCDIAAQRGTLAVGGGSAYLQLLNGELTHIAGITATTIQISFNYTAPMSVGWDTLYATVDAGYSGHWNWADNKHIFVKTVMGLTNQNIPSDYKLNQNYPNPFNPTTKISFAIGNAGLVRLTVYDILGNEVAALLNERKDAGSYEIEFKGENLSSGVYFYKLETNQFTDIKRMTLIK
jgi:hypothetical protein